MVPGSPGQIVPTCPVVAHGKAVAGVGEGACLSEVLPIAKSFLAPLPPPPHPFSSLLTLLGLCTWLLPVSVSSSAEHFGVAAILEDAESEARKVC